VLGHWTLSTSMGPIVSRHNWKRLHGRVNATVKIQSSCHKCTSLLKSVSSGFAATLLFLRRWEFFSVVLSDVASNI